jgi:hypothetical protein
MSASLSGSINSGWWAVGGVLGRAGGRLEVGGAVKVGVISESLALEGSVTALCLPFFQGAEIVQMTEAIATLPLRSSHLI